MNQKEYYKKLKELYNVDYANLYSFILDRTDVPLTKNK